MRAQAFIVMIETTDDGGASRLAINLVRGSLGQRSILMRTRGHTYYRTFSTRTSFPLSLVRHHGRRCRCDRGVAAPTFVVQISSTSDSPLPARCRVRRRPLGGGARRRGPPRD